MSVCAFNSLPKGEYANLTVVAALSTKSLPITSGMTSLPIKNSYSLTFFDDKSEISLSI